MSEAARAIDYWLLHEQGAIYKAWRSAWDATLAPDDNALIKFMGADRAQEVHRCGSSRSVGQVEIELPQGQHTIYGWMVTTSGPTDMTSPAAFGKPTYSYTIDGTNRKATEACAAYLVLLEKMVAQFEADHP